MVGFDTETRPSFRAGVGYKVSLLQLSTPEVCYLFRLCNIRLSNPILKILGSHRIIKVGVDITGDIRSLHALRHFKADGFVDLQNEASRWGIEEKSLRKLSAIVLGQRVSKAQRLSNWEAGILTDQQKEYAATDAWVSMHILERMMQDDPREGSCKIITIEEQKTTSKSKERVLDHRPRHRRPRHTKSHSATKTE
jgi:ribonuclease D